jgi:hypothetical protein
MIVKYLASLPIIGNKKTEADIEELMKARSFTAFTFELVKFMFLQRTFRADRNQYINSLLDQEEKEIFSMDLTQIDFRLLAERS